jgi:hypothetical protein
MPDDIGSFHHKTPMLEQYLSSFEDDFHANRIVAELLDQPTMMDALASFFEHHQAVARNVNCLEYFRIIGDTLGLACRGLWNTINVVRTAARWLYR